MIRHTPTHTLDIPLESLQIGNCIKIVTQTDKLKQSLVFKEVCEFAFLKKCCY